MSAFGWAGLGVNIAKWAGDERAKEIAEKYFRGDFSVTIGTRQQATFGSRLTHIFGKDHKLLMTGPIFGAAGLLGGQWLNETAGLWNLLGVNGDVTFVFGPKTEAVYGGPKTVIQRAPLIRKVSYLPVSGPLAGTLSPNLLTYLQSIEAPPKEPGGRKALELDAKAEKAVRILGYIMGLATMALELAVRIKYPDYGKPSNDQKVNADNSNTVAAVLATASSQFPMLCMSLIHGFETAHVYGHLGTVCLAQLKYIAAEGKKVLKTAATVLFWITIGWWGYPIKWAAEKFDAWWSRLDDNWKIFSIVIVLLGLVLACAFTVMGLILAGKM